MGKWCVALSIVVLPGGCNCYQGFFAYPLDLVHLEIDAVDLGLCEMRIHRVPSGSLCVSRIWLVNSAFYQRETGIESKEILGIHIEPSFFVRKKLSNYR
jgi:hypothetical protein